jgi:hypothetical protein
MSFRVGVPHIKGEIRAARAANYSFNKALNDLIDNAIYKHRTISY